MLVERMPVIFQIIIKLKQISPSTNRLVKVKIKYIIIYKYYANVHDSTFLQGWALGF